MTRKELEKYFKKSEKSINTAVRKAAKKHLSIRMKMENLAQLHVIEFSEKETLQIVDEILVSDIIKITFKEYLLSLRNEDYYVIKGTQNFLKRWRKTHSIRCCNTCKYCTPRKRICAPSIPYCSFYKKTLADLRAHIYNDYCSDYVYANYDKPVVWFTRKAPLNLNKFGELVEGDFSNQVDLKTLHIKVGF